MQDEPNGPELKSGDSVLTMTIQLTRAATGKVEEYTLTAIPEPTESDS